MTAPAAPEVRQCRDPDDRLFGAVAVAAGDNRWGIIHPDIGGHWAKTSDVADWATIG